MNLSLFGLKLIFAAAVFISGGFGVLIAWAQRGGARGERFMAWGDSFAAGVLGGAGLVHLLSRGAGGFRALAPGFNYPLAFVLAGVGFMLILLIEAVIAADPDPAKSPLHCGSRGASHEIGPEARSSGRHPFILVLLLVLSIHSIIVGITLGAQNSIAGALIVFIAIIAHKSAAGFALGISYRRAGYSLRRTAPMAAFFSGMTPLGILTGATVAALVSAHGGQLFQAIFDSIGAGTFLYIAAMDIMRTEFELPGDRWQKWLLVFAGFALMAALALWL